MAGYSAVEMSFPNDGGVHGSMTQRFNDRVAKLFGVLENSSTLQGLKAASAGEDGAKEASTRAEDIDRGGGCAENPPASFIHQHSSKWLVSGSVPHRRTVREESDEDPDDEECVRRHRPFDDDCDPDDDEGEDDDDDDDDDDRGAEGDGGYVFRRRQKKGEEYCGDVENEGDDDNEDEESHMRAMMGRDRTLDFEEEEDEYDKYATGRQGDDHPGFWLTRTKQTCDGREQFAGRGSSLWIDAIAPLPTTLAELKSSRRDMRADALAAAARLEEDDKEMKELEMQLREESRKEVNRLGVKEKAEVKGMGDEEEEEAVAMDDETDHGKVVKMGDPASSVGEENTVVGKNEVERGEESKMKVNEVGAGQSSDASGKTFAEEGGEEIAQDEMKDAGGEEAKEEGRRDVTMIECSTGRNIDGEVNCMATGEEGVRGVGENISALVGQARGMELSARETGNDADGRGKEGRGCSRATEDPTTAVAEIRTAQAAIAMMGGERIEGRSCPQDGDTDSVPGHSAEMLAEECNSEGTRKKKKRVRFLLTDEKGVLEGKEEEDGVNLASTGNPEDNKVKKRPRSVIVLAGEACEGTGCEGKTLMSNAGRDGMASCSSLSSTLSSSSVSTSASAASCRSSSCFAPSSSAGYDWRSSIKGVARRFEESLTRSMNEIFSRRSRVPDHVRNPHKYTYYSLDWSDEDDEEKERKRNLSALDHAREMVSPKRSDDEAMGKESYLGGFAVAAPEVSGGSGEEGKTAPKDEQEEGRHGGFPPGSIKFVPRKAEQQRTVALARARRKTSCSQVREINEDEEMKDCGSEECCVVQEEKQQQQEEGVDEKKAGCCASVVAQEATNGGGKANSSKDTVCSSVGEFLPVGIAAGAVVEEFPDGERVLDGHRVVERSSMEKEEKAKHVEDPAGESRHRGRPKSRSSRNYRSKKSAEEDAIDDEHS